MERVMRTIEDIVSLIEQRMEDCKLQAYSAPTEKIRSAYLQDYFEWGHKYLQAIKLREELQKRMKKGGGK